MIVRIINIIINLIQKNLSIFVQLEAALCSFIDQEGYERPEQSTEELKLEEIEVETYLKRNLTFECKKKLNV